MKNHMGLVLVDYYFFVIFSIRRCKVLRAVMLHSNI